jgi:hypothetical protein
MRIQVYLIGKDKENIKEGLVFESFESADGYIYEERIADMKVFVANADVDVDVDSMEEVD